MRYFHRPTCEASESTFLRERYGKRFEPFGYLSLPDHIPIGVEGLSFKEIDGEILAIHSESASWAFLDGDELACLQTAKTFSDLKGLVGDDLRALDFIAHLWRRGLISLGYERAVLEDIFDDSPNYEEGNLIELLVTEKCNLACTYCLAGAGPEMPTMDEETGKRTIDLAFAMNEAEILAFEFAGGEPFLKFPLMQELVNYIQTHSGAYGRRLFLSIQTNATLLDEERVRWLLDNDIRLGISIDGGAFAQNQSRPTVSGGESYTSLMRGVQLLKDYGVPFGGLVVLNRSNIDDPVGLANFMLMNDIHGFRINPVAFLGDARKNWDQVGLRQDEVVAFFKGFLKYLVTANAIILEDNIHSMLNFLTSKQRRTRCMRSHCGAGDTFQAIAANGDIYPCGRATQSPGLKIGNIFDQDIESLSSPSRHHPRIEEIRHRRPKDFIDCANCLYRQLCQAGCSAQAWERYGTVRHKTPECDFYKTLYPWLMRWLSFDQEAFSHLNYCSYFEGDGLLFQQSFLAVG